MKQRIRLSLVLIAIIAVISTSFSVTFYYYDLFQKQVKEDLKATAVILENYDINTYIKNTTNDSPVRITWIGEDGSVIYDNDISINNLKNHLDRPEVKAAFSNGSGEAVRMSDTLGMDTFYYAVKLKDNTVLRLSKDINNLMNVFFHSLSLIVIISTVIALLCVAISQWLTNKLLEPIEATIDHLEDPSIVPKYTELIPFVSTIQKQHEDILAAAKMRQDFSANVSHELKTPLTVISGYAELIENDMVDPAEQKDFAKEIRLNAKRLVTLINDIIRLSELDSDKEIQVEEVDLYHVIDSILPTLNDYAKGKKVNINFKGEHLKLNGNATLLEELFYNLCQNAIQYNKPNGTVDIILKKEDRITFEIKDTGIGIPKEDQAHVFERFYRVDKSRSKKTGGTGLGLAIVKHVVEFHGATIQLNSIENEGTTIKVIF